MKRPRVWAETAGEVSVLAPPTVQQSAAARIWRLEGQRSVTEEEGGEERMETKENKTEGW